MQVLLLLLLLHLDATVAVVTAPCGLGSRVGKSRSLFPTVETSHRPPRGYYSPRQLGSARNKQGSLLPGRMTAPAQERGPR